MMRIHRRQLLKALGLGAASAIAAGNPLALADGPSSPTRIVFFVTPHAHVPKGWLMPIPSGPTNAFASRSLIPLAPSEFSDVLRPLHSFRDRLLVVEGLAHTSVLADIAQVMKTGGDLNNHSVGVAGTLTGTRALQVPNLPCTGGARSIDQELALRTVAPGRFGSRVYGFDYVPNSTVAPFSFLGPGQSTPVVADPATAFADLMGYYVPPKNEGPPKTRDQAIAALRPSVLDGVAREYELLAPRLDTASRKKLEDHHDLVRQLEASLGTTSSAKCDPTFVKTGDQITQFMRLIKLAFACDLTRVATFVAPVPQATELGYPANATMHGYAHESIEGATSCGTTYEPIAAQAMTDLGIWYANHFATLLQELDSVIEGSGKLLDQTVVVWVNELATPTHLHHDHFVAIAGGGNGFFDTGRYVRYPRDFTNPITNYARVGPAHNRLLVSLLQAMGQSDTTFGMKSAMGSDGSTIPMVGPLTELHRI
ncbi:hypothetical protein BH09MYX1_BH09MYX1_21310 [soil metagenome]